MLNENKIKSCLSHNAKVFTYDIIDSTNNEAKKMLREGLNTNAVLVAGQQSGGRGRQGKSFYSPKDTGLYMSVVLCGQSIPDNLFITSAAAVLTAQAIEEFCDSNIQIKWVNDLYVDNKKVCGILTEAVRNVEGQLIGMVVGIGINLNTVEFPDEISDTAASLGGNIDRNRLAAAIAQKFFSADLNDKGKYLTEYKDRSMVIGKEITYYINNAQYYGVAVDINENGGLIVRNDGGFVTLDSGEISLRLR